MPAFFKKGTRKQRRRRNHVLIVLGVGVLFSLFVIFIQPFASIQLWLSDQLFLPTSPSPNVVIVAIDDESLAQYGKWSEWPRSLHAQAIENLNQARAMVIGFDVLFADQSADDPDLAEAIANASNVVLPAVGIAPMSSPQSEITYRDFLSPTSALEEAAAAIGHANVVPDGDGVIRRIPIVVRDTTGEDYPAFILAMLYTFFATPLPDDYTIQNGALYLIDRDVPVDSRMQMRINFVDKPDSFTRLSYADVIEGNFDPDIVKHKIVLVGMTATGEPDSWVTPVSAEKMYGVEIYANAIDTILKMRFLAEASNQTTALLVLLLVGITGFALPLIRLRWGTLLTVGLFVGYLLAVFYTFDQGYILNIIYPLLVLPLVYVTVILCNVLAEQSDRRQIRDLFGRYVSPQVASEILNLADADQLQLGGVRREVTVLFADIRDFTALSERLGPESLVTTLNSYLSVIVECIIANEGMINKFAGDSIMAVWNAPQDQPDHALPAVKAALEAQQAIDEMQEREPDLLKVQLGFGINTGEAVAGNIGAEGRTEYTIIGDAVNLASRICSATPGGHVWIGPKTYEQVKDVVKVEELELQYFKGKAEQVTIYRALELRSRMEKDE
jgi:adenylate cyclase